MRALILYTLLPALLAACASSLPHPDAADEARARERYPELTLAELSRGRELYVRGCDGCHTLKLPNEVASERWRAVVDDMRRDKGVRLVDDEAELITRYLETLSQRGEASRLPHQ